MQRFVLTGAPGAGKTAIIRQLELDDFSIVEEAATDVIALAQAQGIPEPWTHAAFIDSITALQKQRQIRAADETFSFTIDRSSARRRSRTISDTRVPMLWRVS